MRSEAEALRLGQSACRLRGACEVDERSDSNRCDLAACVGPRFDSLAIGMRRLACLAAHRERPLLAGESIDAGQSARLEDVIVQGAAQRPLLIISKRMGDVDLDDESKHRASG